MGGGEPLSHSQPFHCDGLCPARPWRPPLPFQAIPCHHIPGYSISKDSALETLGYPEPGLWTEASRVAGCSQKPLTPNAKPSAHRVAEHSEK